jgi:catechol 2,3-dioxygenase-like lactoylglutathione lyase family enzyme
MTVEHVTGAQLRIARPTNHLAATKAFYVDAVGLAVLTEWDNHEGYDGAVLAIGDATRQLELLQHADAHPSPSSEDQIVLYLGSSDKVHALASRITDAGHIAKTSPNPYWERVGAVCFVDPDGYWLVLSPSAWD